MLEADEYEYYYFSSQILQGTFELSPRRTIGFPLILAAIRSVFDNFLFLQITLGAIYALAAPLVFRLMKSIGIDDFPALLASLAFIFWPSSLYYGTSVYSETAVLPVFLLALSILPSPWSTQRSVGKTIALAVLAGFLLGVAAHIRPMYLLFVPVAALIILTEDRLRKIGWFKLGGLVLGFAIIVLPWSMVMENRFHLVILLSSNGGETLAGGLNPKLLDPAPKPSIDVAGRTAWVGPGKWLPPFETGYLTQSELRLPYLEQDKLLKDRAIDWILAHPTDAATLEMYKFAYMWGLYPILKNSHMQIVFGNLPLLGLLGLSLYFLLRLPASRHRFVRLWILALYVTGIGLISWGSWRFRQTADVGLLAYCVVCGWGLYGRTFKKMEEPATIDPALPDDGVMRAV